MQLPDEDGLRDHIRLGLAAELRLADEILGVALGLFDGNFAIHTENVPGFDELWLALGAIAKSCQQFRAVVAIVELGLGDVANSNCRMLVETSLAAQFLMQPVAILRQGN